MLDAIEDVGGARNVGERLLDDLWPDKSSLTDSSDMGRKRSKEGMLSLVWLLLVGEITSLKTSEYKKDIFTHIKSNWAGILNIW